VQFLEIFRSDLFFELARHANKMAQLLSSGVLEAQLVYFTQYGQPEMKFKSLPECREHVTSLMHE
jgi:threonine aldolase